MSPKDIVDQMMSKDAFSKWLGIKILVVEEGYCKLEMTTREEMVNGFGILHGGISYSLADSALAFASNSRGNHAVSIDTQISHLKKVGVNEKLIATSREISSSKSVGVYQIEITNSDNILVALFKGTVFRMDKEWGN
ncbi:MAG: hotdog fold thioesterase [Crocinitomicaceae bacterium]